MSEVNRLRALVKVIHTHARRVENVYSLSVYLRPMMLLTADIQVPEKTKVNAIAV
jgi:hypothetical protein